MPTKQIPNYCTLSLEFNDTRVLLGSIGWGCRQLTTCRSASSSIASLAVYRSQIKIWPQSDPLITNWSPQKLASFICQKKNYMRTDFQYIKWKWSVDYQFTSKGLSNNSTISKKETNKWYFHKRMVTTHCEYAAFKALL